MLLNKQYDTLTVAAPASIDEVRNAIGNEKTLTLVKKWGGITIRLPAKANTLESNELAQAIGLDALKALCKALGHARYLYLPRCADVLRNSRDIEIIAKAEAAIRNNAPLTPLVDEIALEYGLSDRQVWNIMKRTIEEDKQESLFNGPMGGD
jgi:Mor family transcriptional regulator